MVPFKNKYYKCKIPLKNGKTGLRNQDSGYSWGQVPGGDGEEGFWTSGHVLFLHLGAGNTDVSTYRNPFCYTYDSMYVYFNKV